MRGKMKSKKREKNEPKDFFHEGWSLEVITCLVLEEFITSALSLGFTWFLTIEHELHCFGRRSFHFGINIQHAPSVIINTHHQVFFYFSLFYLFIFEYWIALEGRLSVVEKIYWCEYKGLMGLVCIGGEMEWRSC